MGKKGKIYSRRDVGGRDIVSLTVAFKLRMTYTACLGLIANGERIQLLVVFQICKRVYDFPLTP